MTDVMRNELMESVDGDSRAAFVDFNNEQLAVLIESDKYDDRNSLVVDAANQACKNICRAAMNQAVLAKDKAFRKGQTNVVAALEVEYQKYHALLIKL